MANEKLLIDLQGINMDEVDTSDCTDIEDILSAVITYLSEQPIVEAVEVVRCENCQYWNPRYETMGMCMKHNAIVTFTKPDFYCAWGKGKNDGICKED